MIRKLICELPPYEDAAAPNFVWGEIYSETFVYSIDNAMQRLCIRGGICLRYHQENLANHLLGSYCVYSMPMEMDQPWRMLLSKQQWFYLVLSSKTSY